MKIIDIVRRNIKVTGEIASTIAKITGNKLRISNLVRFRIQ